MSPSEGPQPHSAPPVELPTERDLDRLTGALRSTGRDRGFPRRVIDRYQQWIFLFVGWCLKAPPGEVSRERIGDFWAALSEHPGAGKARTCEAMDALGFFFGHLQREARLLFLSEDPGDAAGTPQARGRYDEGFSRPNPSLRMRTGGTEGPPSTESLSNRQLSRYLPSGTLPEETNARTEIPTQETAQCERPGEGPRETTQEASKSREERGPRDTSVTLFNPQGRARPAGDSDSSGASASSEAPAAPAPEPGEAEPDDEPEGTGSDDRQQPDSDRVSVHLPQSVADRLQKAANRLGLPPSVFAARAIELVCDDAGIERLDTPDAESPLERYQTQIDLLQLQEEGAEEFSSEESSAAEREDEPPAQTVDPDGKMPASGEGSGEDAQSNRDDASGEDESHRAEGTQGSGDWGATWTSGGDGRGDAVSGPSL